ncbi:MAG: DUF2281 domain-containing protein [Gammaproteobacteria bacterium]|nr:DUF2281 domain-containing protein [Gammaproteobacteria bacterium]
MSDVEKSLLKSLRQLPEVQQQTLLDYAEFLTQRYAVEDELVLQQPVDISRPAEESVVKAVRRLSKTYPMLESKEIFEKTSSFMMRNLMRGEGSETVIDEMEIFFSQSYKTYIDDKDQG